MRWLFVGFAIAFMVKTPVFPLHTWLPDAHTEAPTAGSIDLAGVLLKLGTYGFLRFGLYLFPEATIWAAPVMLTLASIGILYGAAVAAMQHNLKRLVAYSSVAHMGFAVLGVFAITQQSIDGAVMVMINHGITTGALFILLGFLYTRRHTYEINELKGLAKVAPWFAGVFTLVMLSSIGVPGLNGFVGEFLVLLGHLRSPTAGGRVVAASGVILAALYLLWAYQRVFHGEPDEANKTFPDLKVTEKLVMVPLIGLIVFLGIYPKPLLERIEPSVRVLIAHVETEVPSFHAATPQVGSRQSSTRGRPPRRSALDGHATPGAARDRRAQRVGRRRHPHRHAQGGLAGPGARGHPAGGRDRAAHHRRADPQAPDGALVRPVHRGRGHRRRPCPCCRCGPGCRAGTSCGGSPCPARPGVRSPRWPAWSASTGSGCSWPW